MLLGCAVLEEIEVGWGQRSDGYFVFQKSEDLEKHRERLKESQKKYPQEFTIIGNVLTIEVKQEFLDFVGDFEGGKWISNNDFRKFKESEAIKIIK